MWVIWLFLTNSSYYCHDPIIELTSNGIYSKERCLFIWHGTDPTIGLVRFHIVSWDEAADQMQQQDNNDMMFAGWFLWPADVGPTFKHQTRRMYYTPSDSRGARANLGPSRRRQTEPWLTPELRRSIMCTSEILEYILGSVLVIRCQRHQVGGEVEWNRRRPDESDSICRLTSRGSEHFQCMSRCLAGPNGSIHELS